MCCYKTIIPIFLSIIIIVIILIAIFTITPQTTANNLQAIKTLNNVQSSAGGSIPITFDNNRVQNGNAITHSEGSSEISLTESGTYLVNFSLTGSLEIGLDPTLFFVSLYQDNIIVPGSTTTSLIIPSGQESTISNSALIQINGNSTISLIATSVSDIIYVDASISVIKIA